MAYGFITINHNPNNLNYPIDIAMNVSEIMSKNVVSVEMDDMLSEVKAIFENTRFHHLLVIENSKLMGIISDRDLLKAISPNVGTPAASKSDEASLNKRVHQIMSRNPITLSADATVEDAIEVFNQNQVSCIPIVSREQEALGILSWRDILKSLK